MGGVQDDEGIQLLRMGVGVGPGHGAAPVVADQCRPAAAQLVDDCVDIVAEVPHPVGLNPVRLVALVVAAQVDRDDVVILGQGRDLIAPGEPEIREPVEQEEERTGALVDVVELHAARTVDVAALNAHVRCRSGARRSSSP